MTMRLNPFSRRVGKRRAAMTGADTPDEAAPDIEREAWSENASPANDDTIELTDDGKQFGFAYRQEAERQRQAAAEKAETPCPPVEDLPATAPSAENPPPVAAAEAEATAVSTPHIERLRAEIGADAADVIERRLPEEPDAGALSDPHPKFRSRFWQGEANEPPAPPAPEPVGAPPATVAAEPGPPAPAVVPAIAPPFL
ncbi:MAG: hypothetical protein ACR2RE_25085, partial [Geminicoccaceae bacterium]